MRARQISCSTQNSAATSLAFNSCLKHSLHELFCDKLHNMKSSSCQQYLVNNSPLCLGWTVSRRNIHTGLATHKKMLTWPKVNTCQACGMLAACQLKIGICKPCASDMPCACSRQQARLLIDILRDNGQCQHRCEAWSNSLLSLLTRLEASLGVGLRAPCWGGLAGTISCLILCLPRASNTSG